MSSAARCVPACAELGFSGARRSQSTSDAAAGLELQQLVQLGPMRVREWFDRGAVDPPIGSRNGFRAARSITLSAGRMRRFCRRLSGPDRPAASLCRSAGPARLARARGAEVGQAERGQLQVGAQFTGMLATGHVALAVLCPARRLGGLASPPTG